MNTTLEELSCAQERMWVLEKFKRHPALYHISMVIGLDFTIDKLQLAAALSTLLQEHKEMRAGFKETLAGIQKKYAVIGNISIQEIALNNLLPDLVDLEQHPELQTFFLTPFDLSNAPLLRVAIAKIKDKNYLLFAFHHLIMDGWSASLFIQLLGQYFFKQPVSKANDYNDYVTWEKMQLTRKGFAKHISYWQQRLGHQDWKMDLTPDYLRPQQSSGHGATYVTSFTTEVYQALQMFAKQHAVSVAQVVLAAFQLFIAQYSNQTAIALAMPIFGRNQSQWHKTLGLFVNTQIYTAALDYQATFLQLIKHTKQQMLNDAAYTDIPYNLLLKKFYETELCAPGTACNVLFNYIQMPVLQFGNAVPHAHYCLMPTSKFELSLHNYVTQNHFYLIFEYATDLFKLATIQHFAEYFQQLLQACIADPDVSLTAITEAL